MSSNAYAAGYREGYREGHRDGMAQAQAEHAEDFVTLCRVGGAKGDDE